MRMLSTSCDDTSVAILEETKSANNKTGAVLHFHKKVTSNNTSFQGVHPLVSLQSHQENLAKLVDEALRYLPSADLSNKAVDHGRCMTFPSQEAPNQPWTKRLPDFVSVTRGPGMRSNLFTGVDTAKGLAAAWQVPLVGVHHMQAHALTPRLVAALQQHQDAGSVRSHVQESTQHHPTINAEPQFPFLSVLASGGHTLLIHSASLTDHKVLGSTSDIAVGECLDKIARVVLPEELLQIAKSTMYAALLEEFAFPLEMRKDTSISQHTERVTEQTGKEARYLLEDSTAEQYISRYQTQEAYGYGYVVPKNQEDARRHHTTTWGWVLAQPLSKAAGGSKNKSLEMSFSGLLTYVERLVQFGVDQNTGKLNKCERSVGDVTIEERRALAREAMRAAFEHVVGRVILGLDQLSSGNSGFTPVKAVVMAGGVAANLYLRWILASVLKSQGNGDTRIIFPPPSLCTDNAAMIAWAGIEMYHAGHSDTRSIRAIRKWPLDQILSPPETD
ncbi:hypothetical protein BDV96DRAFT_615391 [Lophiotrema nucula]|uniref:Gcp-like domain-containing protein n=1 Tax=Lophiotrema nucula TaxID=690887 RepID=A0A6A5YS80_9PLEO|nr:hypothetical protein BDV96DRAFT_615391 [Lophiotrema nucula]